MQIRFFLFAAAFAISLGGAASAHDYKVGAIEIVHPWSRATPKGAPVAGGYLKITNKGAEPDRLVGGSAAFAGQFQIHEMKMSNDVMQMRPFASGLEIKPGETVELKPGSTHVMFMGLKQPLKEGDRVKGTLVFEKAGTVEVEYLVEAIGGTPNSGHMGH